jgi:hypothetical protein
MTINSSAAGRPQTTIHRLPQPKVGEKFLEGPIPLDWLSTAAQLPGKSLHLAIAIWAIASLAKSARVSIGNVAVQPFGLDRNAKYRALQWLEEASLIRVQRKPGQSPIVTLLELEARQDDVAS